jgi:thioredoxin reductase (NADPH)
MRERALAHPKIQVRWNSVVADVLGNDHVTGVRLRDPRTGNERDEETDGVFIAIGHRPNTEAFRDWLTVDEKGYLVVRDQTGTAIPGVFVAGDVHDHRYRQAVTAAGDGCRAAIDVERWLEAEGEEPAQQAPHSARPAQPMPAR